MHKNMFPTIKSAITTNGQVDLEFQESNSETLRLSIFPFASLHSFLVEVLCKRNSSDQHSRCMLGYYVKMCCNQTTSLARSHNFLKHCILRELELESWIYVGHMKLSI